MDGIRPWLALARTPGLHAGLLAPLLARYGDAEALLSAKRRELLDFGMPPSAVKWLESPDQALLDRDERWLEVDSHHYIHWGSAHYPPLLREVADAPVGLFVDGDGDVLALPQIAIVGSRNPTHSGAETARAFAAHLASGGFTITSGLAIGIDAASHRGALEVGGTTVAVCGTGLDITYPASHKALRSEIAARGVLVSEFPLGTPPAKQNFPRRNRLISGMSVGTLVVEAAIQSGSLITARLAASQGREVFAIPGSIHNPLTRGCHQLIREGATLVESAQDIFPQLRQLTLSLAAHTVVVEATKAADSTRVSGSPLDKDHKILLDALGFEPAGVDLLVQRTGLQVSEVASMLLILELDGRIESFPGGLYVRAHPEGTK
ncbi:MAG: DNA-processing protein DprA [Steroidobacteraceae bacterium]